MIAKHSVITWTNIWITGNAFHISQFTSFFCSMNFYLSVNYMDWGGSFVISINTFQWSDTRKAKHATPTQGLSSPSSCTTMSTLYGKLLMEFISPLVNISWKNTLVWECFIRVLNWNILSYASILYVNFIQLIKNCFGSTKQFSMI